MARTPIDTPNELRRRIQKCNHSISKIMEEMAAFQGTNHFIDWTGLIDRLKTYRKELETELLAKIGVASATAPEPTSAPDPDEYLGTGDEDFNDDEDEISY